MEKNKKRFEEDYREQLDYILNSMVFSGEAERRATRAKLADFVFASLTRRKIWEKCNDKAAIAAEISLLPVTIMADIIPVSNNPEEFMSNVVKSSHSATEGYTSNYSSALKAAGPFPWNWKFDTQSGRRRHIKKRSMGEPLAFEKLAGSFNGKSIADFIGVLKMKRPLLANLLEHGKCGFLDNVLVIQAKEDAARSINNDMPALKSHMGYFFGHNGISVNVLPPLQKNVKAPAPLRMRIPASELQFTEKDLSLIEMIMLSMDFANDEHRISVMNDLIEYFRETYVLINRKHSGEGPLPALNIYKTRMFKFARIVKRAKDKEDFRRLAQEAFKDDKTMHTPGRAISKVNRGWGFQWNLNFRRKVVTNRHEPPVNDNDIVPVKDTVQDTTVPVPAADATQVEQMEMEMAPEPEQMAPTNVLDMGGMLVPPVQQQQTCPMQMYGSCPALLKMHEKLAKMEAYLIRHFHRSNGVSCIPDDAITKDLKEAANAGK